MRDASSDKRSRSWVARIVILSVGLMLGWLGLVKFIRARNVSAKNACIANLKQIDCAVQQWALENKKTATDTYSLSDSTLLACLRGSVLPICPDGGRYLPGRFISSDPKCSIGGLGHTL
jgi:hypothetical protein